MTVTSCSASSALAELSVRGLLEHHLRLPHDLQTQRCDRDLAGQGAGAPPLADDAKKQIGSGVVVFIGVAEDGKASAVVGVTDDLTSRYSAVDLVRVASAARSVARAAT